MTVQAIHHKLQPKLIRLKALPRIYRREMRLRRQVPARSHHHLRQPLPSTRQRPPSNRNWEPSEAERARKRDPASTRVKTQALVVHAQCANNGSHGRAT